ncbi:hypothetical protein LCD36_05515 [Saccharopolyspora sp. 6T]|uniref:hypothetical protein n=1 Tax=Saccharopolyspora sp. 6T TaxID=2877238 RepID=UPI001CD7FE6E|nr:hypothetical protein [Saccharopolyspora sp. 6T]MCA1185907.1 hypothetical protein [Saccharopolyspora sp. 6T]
MTAAYANALDEAVRLPEHSDAVNRIKQAVINEIRATDERIRIRTTDYFNHSFVPDLVLQWPKENEERIMFLRPDPNPGYIQEDIESAEDKNSIFYCLTNLGDDYRTTSEALHESSRQRQTLVTDPGGLAQLETQRRQNPAARLASTAVLQGARGLLDGVRAVSVSDAVTQGIDAASRTNTESTRRAVSTIGDAFDPSRSSRLIRLLQAIWVGAGGNSSSFPGGRDFTEGLDEEALSYLLNLDNIGDFKFWRRIGRTLSLEKLTGLQVDDYTGNFQLFVSANVDVLQAKVCRVVDVEPTLSSDEQTRDEREFKWGLEYGSLVFRNDHVAAYVGEKNERIQSVPEFEDHGVSFRTFQDRATLSQIRTSELTLAAGGRSVSYSADGAINVARDDRLIAISQALGKDAVVQKATLQVPGHSPLGCNFLSRTTKGQTTALYPVIELIRLSISLLVGLEPEEQEQLRAIDFNARDEPTLFD